jgi:arylsulfatase A-like enzyme
MPRSPNVVVFFTDQQRHDSTGLHGNPLDLTPNLDRLARAGTHVANSFTCQPVCCPARSCLQTGQYATQTGCWKNGIPMRPDAVTLAKCFSAAGYDTGYIGKWHLGDDSIKGPVAPELRGGYDYWLAAQALEHTSDAYHTRLWDRDSNPVDLSGYRVDALTDAANRYIAEHARASKPFFLFVSFLEPHHQNDIDDYPPPTGYRERYTGRFVPPDLQALGGSSARHLGGYWGMVKRLDEALGRMQDTLDSLGIADDTIVLFTSDHACHFCTRNAEYKRSCHESSIRVPTALWGGPFSGGGQIRQLVSLVDLPPTLLDAAGIEIPKTMVGRSLLPLIRGDRTAMDSWPQEVFVQISESHVGRAVRTARWKYAVAAPDKSGWNDSRSDRYVESFLYDLEADPHELRNLVDSRRADHVAVRDELRATLIRRMVEAGEAAPTIEPATS